MQSQAVLHHNYKFTVEQLRSAVAAKHSEIPTEGVASFRTGENPDPMAPPEARGVGILTVSLPQDGGKVLERSFYLAPLEIRDALVTAGSPILTDGDLFIIEQPLANGQPGVLVRVSVKQ